MAQISGKVLGMVLLSGTDQWRGFGKGSSEWHRSVARFFLFKQSKLINVWMLHWARNLLTIDD